MNTTRARLTGLLSALFCIACLEASADACSPPLPGVTGSIPKDGETYPANAAIYFQGYNIGLGSVTVTVDGQPASFTPAQDAATEFAPITARVTPTPTKGQVVKIEGDFCPSDNCGTTSITYTAGDSDGAPPASPSAISFDIHDYPDFKSSGGDCQVDSDLAWWIDVNGAPAGADESKVILTLEAFRDETFNEVVLSRSTFLNEASATIKMTAITGVLNGVEAPGALCFRATLHDAAGNQAAEAVHTCKPCNYRKDPAGSSPTVPAEPMWTSADVFPGGTCDLGGGGAGGAGGAGGGAGGDDPGTGGGGEDGDEGDCSCRAPGGGGSDGALAAIALLGGAVALRRRRR